MEYINIICNLCGSSSHRVVSKGPDFEYRCVPDEFAMVECIDCGLVYLNPRPAASELGVIYPASYVPYHFDQYLPPAVNNAREYVQKRKVLALKKYVGADAVVWDVGCGGGFFLDCLRKYGNPGWRLAGIDISTEAIKKVVEKGHEGIVGRFESMIIPPESVDVIVLNQVIEHLDNPAGVVRKAGQVLRRGGIVFIETPSLEGWDAKLFKNRYWGGWHFPRHWTLFNSKTAAALLSDNGFVVVKKNYLLSPTFWAQSFHHLMVDKGVSERIAGVMAPKNPFAMITFSLLDIVQIMFGHTSNMRIVARKP